MKKLIMLFLFIAGATNGNAQIKTLNTRPVVPASRMDSIMPKQKVDLRKLVGKDLTIALVSIDKNNNNFKVGMAGSYIVNFDVINSGGEDININGITIQTYMNAVSVSSLIGGYAITPSIPNFPANGILHPGEKFRSSYRHIGFDPANNSGNKFVVKVDESNTIAETNENNNTLEIPVIGNLESWSTPLPDLTFQINSIAPVTGSTFLNTALDVSVVNIGAGEIPIDVVRQIIPMVEVYPAGNPGTNLYNEAFSFATNVTGTQTYPGYYRADGPLKPGDKVRIGGSVHINGLTSGANIIFHFRIGAVNNPSLPETNLLNNTVDFLYTVK